MTTPVVPRIESPPDDAEARVPGLPGEPFAVPHPDLDDDVPGASVRGGDRRDLPAHHPARYGVDGGLAHRDRQTGPGHRPDPRPRPELDPAPASPLAHRGVDEREVGDVGVVARVLDDAGAGEPGAERLLRERERGPLPLRKIDGDRVRKPSRQERGIRGRGRGGGAGPGGPAASQALSFGRRHPAILARMAPRNVSRAAPPAAPRRTEA